MSEAMGDYVEAILLEDITVVLQAFMSALAILIARDSPQLQSDESRLSALGHYEKTAWDTSHKGHYERRAAPTPFNAPSWSRQGRDNLVKKLAKSIEPLSLAEGLAFLGELTGKWILACPAENIRQHDIAINSPQHRHSLSTEEELIFVMNKWLTYSLDVGR